MGLDILLYAIIIIIPLVAHLILKIFYNHNISVLNSKGLTGYDVARIYLDNIGLNTMDVVETRGTLTDHFDPRRKVIRLSTDVYHEKSIASMAVAAHECGHADQHRTGFVLMKIRSAIVPFVNICTRIAYVVIIIGIAVRVLDIVNIGIALISTSLLFQLITLPVEINASIRAKKKLKELDLIGEGENSGINNVLISAAMTYVAGVLTSILEIFRLIMRYNNNRR